MKGLLVYFVATVIVSVASGYVQSMWDYHREHDTSVSSPSRIINGVPATNGQIPYQIRLTIFLGTVLMAWCGGSLIAPTWVLTAAHCTTSGIPIFLLDYALFYVEAGSVVANEPVQKSSTTFLHIHFHDDYDSNTLKNDIALIETDTPFDFNTVLVKPIALVAANTNPNTYVGRYMKVSGFGATSDGGAASDVLLFTEALRIISFSECQAAFGTDPIPTTSFCAVDTSPPITAVCSGDSGGPVTLVIAGKLVQIGVVSYASNAGCDDAPQGFTDVRQFIPWIIGITGPL